jgi:hypothetical protein
MVGKERWGNTRDEIWVLLLGVAESCRPFIKICFSVIEAMARQVLVFTPNQHQLGINLSKFYLALKAGFLASMLN